MAIRTAFLATGLAAFGESKRGGFALAPESSHFIYLDAPDLVVENILSVVRETRSSHPGGHR